MIRPVVALLALLLAGCSVLSEADRVWLSGVIREIKCPPPDCTDCEPCPEGPPCPPAPPGPAPGPGPIPTPSDSLVVAPGARLERRLAVPAWVEYRLTGKLPSVEDGGPRDGAHLGWSYDLDWGGGNTTPGGGYIAGWRDYAIKSYHSDGGYAGQVRYAYPWDPAATYLVRLEVGSERSRLVVDGVQVAAIDVRAPAEVTLGIGWPPSVRPGCDGARLTAIRWSP